MDPYLVMATLAVIATVAVGILAWLASIRQSRKKQNTSGLLGKLWNLIKRNPWRFALPIIGMLALVIIWWALRIPVVQDFLSTEYVVTAGTITIITIIALLILAFIIILILLYRKHWLEANKREQEKDAEIAEKNKQITYIEKLYIEKEKLVEQLSADQKSNSDRLNQQTEEINELHHKLREQTESFEALTSARNHLITEYGLDIVSARFGIDASGARTEDVTDQIILGLAEKGKIYLGLNLVGGKENDPVKNTAKKVYMDYIQGGSFSKEFDENYTLSIEDLIQNFKDNASERPRDFGPRQKSKWKIE